MSAQFRAFVSSIILKAHVASGNAPHTAIAEMEAHGIPTAITADEIRFMQEIKRKYVAGTLSRFEQECVEAIPGWDFRSTSVEEADGGPDLANVHSTLDDVINYARSKGALPLPPLV